MKKILSVVLSLIMAVSCFAFPAGAFAAPEKSNAESSAKYVEGEAIVILKSSAKSGFLKASNIKSTFGSQIKVDTSKVMAGTSNSTIYSSKNLKIAAFKSSTLSTKQLISTLEKDENVKCAFPNYIKKASAITNDTYSDYQWALDNKGQNGGTAGADVNAEGLWDKAAQSKDEKIVAVVDTGIDYTHEDLQDSLWINPYGAKLFGKYGYDFSGTNKDLSPLDDNGHGTHVSGIIAAQADNEKGISGINKSNVKIMALKWLDEEGYGDTESVIACYDYIKRAISLGANVVAINNSWGGIGDSSEQQMFDEIFNEFGKLGVASVIAAGNDGSDIEYTEEEDFIFDIEDSIINVPASTQSPYAVVVAATKEDDSLVSFSSYSKKYVDVAAPGTDILSSVSYDCFNPTIYSDSQRETICSDYQGYNSEIDSTSFGYPQLQNEFDVGKKHYSTNATVSLTDKSFGTSGKALAITTNDELKSNEEKMYIARIPYSIEDDSKNYSVSFMFNFPKETMLTGFDVPAGKTLEDLDDSFPILSYMSAGDDYWEHIYYNVDVEEDSEYGFYEKSTDRELVFIFIVTKNNTQIKFDDLAISSQSVDKSEFGKYDFYNGTSMATPYVAGAIALVSNAYPDAAPIDVINMVKNSGRISDALADYTENSRSLSLENPEAVPPLIADVEYNSDNNVLISGSFKNVSSVKINGKNAEVISTGEKEIIVKDKSYSTKRLKVEVTNENGTGTKNTVITNKKLYPVTKKITAPDILRGFYIPAGDIAYHLNDYGTACMIYYDDIFGDGYVYDEFGSEINFDKLFDNEEGSAYIEAATFMNNKIYFVAVNPVYASNMSVIGYDTAFAYLDLLTDKTVKLCDVPNDSVMGATLATYNGNVYLIGGYDCSKNDYELSMYKYNSTSKKFKKTSYTLPEGRVYGKCLQFRSNLVYAYGGCKEGTMPSMLVFDGTKWTKSAVAFDSDDYDTFEFNMCDGKINLYEGNLGYSSNGIYCTGPFVYSLGDSFSYNPETDKVTASKYSLSKKEGDTRIFGTTIPKNYVGFSYSESDDEDDYDFFSSNTSYRLRMETSYATVGADYFSIDNCYVDVGEGANYMYGDKITVTVHPDDGYVATAVTANGKEYSVNSKGVAYVVLTDDVTTISAKVKKVAPNQVKDLKVSSTTATTHTLSWSKPARAQGYQVQQYKNNKWTTVATIKSADTTTYKVAKQSAGTNKYRVRAYSEYNSKKYYGSFSSVLSVYVPSKQSITSLEGASKAFTVNFKKNTSASGYQVQYSTSSSFSGAKTKTITKNTTTSAKISSLSAKKKYYVRVRSYKTVNGKKVYGAWSASKTVTTK